MMIFPKADITYSGIFQFQSGSLIIGGIENRKHQTKSGVHKLDKILTHLMPNITHKQEIIHCVYHQLCKTMANIVLCFCMRVKL